MPSNIRSAPLPSTEDSLGKLLLRLSIHITSAAPRRTSRPKNSTGSLGNVAAAMRIRLSGENTLTLRALGGSGFGAKQ